MIVLWIFCCLCSGVVNHSLDRCGTSVRFCDQDLAAAGVMEEDATAPAAV